ncbi:protein kinase subdomain-containing protein PKL/ccin3 [Coprinopsis cinerea AmutBmut pab1-1]|nr:protein kinase subdomain-containing protein PKL/ccin3 [Coprinopsis cinerea AmutBmut pab1-1]
MQQFAKLRINNCAIVDGKPTAITLEVSPSHPGAIWYRERRGGPPPPNWNSTDISDAEGELELTLLDRISEGRIGITYVAKVVSAKRGNVDLRATLPETVCIKFAKPEFCRGLAREAWFYEQLESCQGTCIPNFYGFFSSSMREQACSLNLEFTPWTTREHHYQEDTDSPPQDNLPSADWLTDDLTPHYAGFESPHEDPSGYQQNSPWYRWNRDADNPTFSVLILELLGEPCTGERGIDVKEAIEEALDDIMAQGVVHGNISAWNILSIRDPINSSRCSRHNAVHSWRVIDFDGCAKVDIENLTDYGTMMLSIGREALHRDNGFKLLSK